MASITEIFIWMMWGILGGVMRIIIVSLKNLALKRKTPWNIFFIYCFVILSVSAFSGIIFSFGGKGFSFLGGYAGMDLAGGYERTFKKTKIKVK